MKPRRLLVVTCIGALAAAILLGGLASGDNVFDQESRYHRILVEEVGTVRTLYFRRGGSRFSESKIDRKRPLELLMEYSRLMFSSLLFVEEPKRILVVGLGGGTIPRVLHHYFPEARIDCVELDSLVVKVAKELFDFEESENLKVHVRDGRRHIKRLLRQKEKYDIIMLDAYRGGYIPFHLTTREFLTECRRLLSSGGILVSNLQPIFRDYDYCRRTIAAVFPEQYAFRGDGNSIVVASPKKLGLTAKEFQERAARLAERHRFRFDLFEVARALEQPPGYRTEGEILSDDYAPVNLLRGRPRE